MKPMQRQSLPSPGPEIPPAQTAPDPPSSRDLAPLPTAADDLLARLEAGESQERERLLKTLGVALVVHLIALFLVIPDSDDQVYDVGRPGKVYVMQQVRFEKPPAPKKEVRKEVPKTKTKKIPIPDPTPDDPEPIEIDDVALPDTEVTIPVEGAPFGIPDAPEVAIASPIGGRFDGEAMDLGAGVTPPKAIHQPQPRYTEDARQARIQGVAILSAVIDAEGKVRNLKLVKGLPLGLSESALETVATWTYEPARLEGRAVAVNYHFTIGFWLQ